MMTASIRCHMATETKLTQLRCPTTNIRQSYSAEAMDQLKASIRSLGVLSPLAVLDRGNGSYEVVAGQRRLRALLELYPGGKHEDQDVDVPIIIVQSDDPTEISLAENVVREEMHPADQFEAFKKLADGGKSIADIAADFCVSERTVKGRLRLAGVAPAIMEAYRSGKLTLGQVEAFALVDDQEAQVEAYEDLSQKRHITQVTADEIRKRLTKKTIRATDRRVRYVTLEAYEAAGGSLYRDLFTEDEDGILIYDEKLLNKLYQEKMDQTTQRLKAEGWSWTEARNKEPGWNELSSDFKEADTIEVELSEEEQAEYDRLTEEAEKIEANFDDDGEIELTEEQSRRLEEIEDRKDELDKKRTGFSDETRAKAGVVIYIDRTGKEVIRAGLIKPSEASLKAKATRAAKSEAKEEDDKKWKDLAYELSSHKTAGIAASLAYKPEVALAVAVYGLGLDILYPETDIDTAMYTGRCGDLFNGNLHPDVTEEGACQGWDTLQQRLRYLMDAIPDNDEDFLPWLLQQSQEDLLGYLGIVTSMRLEPAMRNSYYAFSAKEHNDPESLLNVIGRQLRVDISSWYRLNENDLKRMGKTRLLAAMADIHDGKCPKGRDKLDEAQLVELAMKELPAKGWLPEPLRIPAATAEDKTIKAA